jgi:membrane fusion protein (multidrug efflux system)
VPQLAILRDGQGPYALVVAADGKVLQKRVETVAVVNNNWVISSGLVDGDQVVVSGIPKAQPGTTVKAVPAQPPTGVPASNAGPEKAATGS